VHDQSQLDGITPPATGDTLPAPAGVAFAAQACKVRIRSRGDRGNPPVAAGQATWQRPQRTQASSMASSPRVRSVTAAIDSPAPSAGSGKAFAALSGLIASVYQPATRCQALLYGR